MSPPRKKTKNDEVMRLPTDAPIDFTVHSHLTDAKFIIEGRKIYAGKDFLSLHSPFFHSLFHANFAEKEQDEIEIKDVSYKEFHELLKVLYDPARDIKDWRIGSLLKLGDRYQIKAVVDRVEGHLIQSNNHTKRTKLYFADRFRLVILEIKCKPDEQKDENYREMPICSSIDDMKTMNFIASGCSARFFEGVKYIRNGGQLSECDEYADCAFSFAGLLWELDGYCKKVKGEMQVSFCLVVNNDQPSAVNWSVEGVVEIEVTHPDTGKSGFKKQYEFTLDNAMRKGRTSDKCVLKNCSDFDEYDVVWTRIYLKKVTGVREIPQFDFTAPSPLSDATLVVEDKRLYVNKQYLSIISDRFRAMFDGDPSGVEFELKDVEDVEDCVEFLRWIYPSFTKNLDVDKFDQFLSIAYDFNVPFVSDEIEKFLRDSPPVAFLAHKLCLNVKYYMEIDDHVERLRQRFERDEQPTSDWWLPLIKKSPYYKAQPSSVKMKVLEWIIKLPFFVPH